MLLDGWFEQEIEPLWQRHRLLVEKSLHRKIAHLRESVIAVLKTLLGKRRGTYPRSRDGAELKMLERLLDDGDTAIKHAETRRRDWSADTTGVVTAILQDATRALEEPSRQNSLAASNSVAALVQQSFVQNGQKAREVIINLQRTLIRILESLEKTAPLVKTETATIRNAGLVRCPQLIWLRCWQPAIARSRIGPWCRPRLLDGWRNGRWKSVWQVGFSSMSGCTTRNFKCGSEIPLPRWSNHTDPRPRSSVSNCEANNIRGRAGHNRRHYQSGPRPPRIGAGRRSPSGNGREIKEDS